MATRQSDGAAGRSTRQGLVTRLASRWSAWRRYRSGVARLASMPDAALRDIGVSRGHIPYCARHGRDG